MKNILFVTLGILILFDLALVIIPSCREEIYWKWASFKDEPSNYESFLLKWPDNKHFSEAKTAFDERKWQQALNMNSKDGFVQYLDLNMTGIHNLEANEKIDSLQWKESISVNTILSFRNYNESIQSGRFQAQASEFISKLKADDKPYENALKEGSEASMRKFIEDYPGHQKSEVAASVLIDITEGGDIVDLLKSKKIEVKSQGSGIENVSVSIRRLVPYPITVRIPVGTFFVSANTDAQNMVATSETKVYLRAGGWQYSSLEAACANRPRDIPSGDDTFSVQRSPKQAELVKLMLVLDTVEVSYPIRQAAVWIITDNADYYDLGVLVSRSEYEYYGGSRMINEYESANALQLCDKAGIDIKRKSIWYDRSTILKGLKESNLKTWLEERK